MEPWRVAQIVVDRGPGIESIRGSGYLVAPGVVLTAAHVLAGALAVGVRLDVGQPTEIDVRATRWWADPGGHHGTDHAVVIIPEDVTFGRDVERARFGQIRDCTATLFVKALGFPLFKLRGSVASAGEAGLFRDLDQVTGHVPVAANRRQGTLAVHLDDPPPAIPERAGLSPWEGMSGAAVWADGRIIGVVAEHHASEGTGRLTARRIDRAYHDLPDSDLKRLVTWLELPPAIAGLPDVIPTEPAQLVRSAYLEQVRDIAPDALIGRGTELAEWTEFCAGPEAYAWWQAGPWSGKTALASWFVTHPPAGVDIVSFFITGRLVGQADSDAFLDAMIEQLNALEPVGGQSPPAAGARHGVWLSLIAGAAAQAEERERRLVVVVDGLDEDEAGASPPRGRPSIASLLPRRAPAGARFIITSRPDPGLPDDVPTGHPLRTGIPRRLPVSWVAEDVERRARQELSDLFAGDQTAIDVVGYVAGSGGGLTRSDLSTLIGAAPHKLDSVLRGVFGRSLEARASAYFSNGQADPATRAYLFAHETLRVTVEEQLGTELARYRKGIHDWIHSYARQGWPDATPGYAVRGYLGLLTATRDGGRLLALARDFRRHTFLLRATGSDYAALIEIRNAQRLIAAQDVPDLQALVELAVWRDVISIRNQFIPVRLPAAWARLARFDHAEALARTITDPRNQAEALAALVTATAQAGDPDRAEDLTRTITDPAGQAEALAALATVAAQAGDTDRASRLAADAEALARTITDAVGQARALATVASVIARAGDSDRAEDLARTITDPACQARALATVASVIARAGDSDRAEGLARAITGSADRVEALAALATVAAQAGDPDRASRLAADARTLTRTITNPAGRARALAALAAAAAQAGDAVLASWLTANAEALARTIADPGDRARALAVLATIAAQGGDPDRAEGLARAITDLVGQAEALAVLATIAAQGGDPDRAEGLARAITDPVGQAEALTVLATIAAQGGDPDRAEGLARAITDPVGQAEALTVLATAAAQAGDPDRAEGLARAITDPAGQAEALTALATIAAQAEDTDRASRLAADAEALARTITDAVGQVEALGVLASVTARAGDSDLAEDLARTITDPVGHARALATVASVIARAGDSDRAEALARAITDPADRVEALAALATAAALAGDPDRGSRLAADARTLARTITNPAGRARALAALAAAAAQAGDAVLASWLTANAEVLARLSGRAEALAALATAAALAGDPDRSSRLAADAEVLAGAIADPDDRARTLAALATAAALAGDPDRSSRLAADAEVLARAIADPDDRARTLAALAAAAAQAGDSSRAEALARAVTDPVGQAEALAALATIAVQAGHPDRARHLLALALSVEMPHLRWWIATVSRLFPSIIRDTKDIFLRAYKTGTDISEFD